SLDLLKMLREGLVAEVRSALARARSENGAVRKENVAVREADRFRLVNVEVIPIKVPPSGARCYVVLFADMPVPAPVSEVPASAPADLPPAGAEQQIVQLQHELAATREYLQSLIEAHESA